GEQGKLFGSVTARDIAEALQSSTRVELEHRQVDLREPIRELGVHEVTVNLTRNVHAKITVSVEPLGGVVAAEEETPEAAVREEQSVAEEVAESEPEAEVIQEADEEPEPAAEETETSEDIEPASETESEAENV
ncbi:MAG: 50S ribosomal L9 C-terminal domain-containing protein, partial [Candidatus Binatia bacterium]